jgi:hypothetical protein
MVWLGKQRTAGKPQSSLRPLVRINQYESLPSLRLSTVLGF